MTDVRRFVGSLGDIATENDTKVRSKEAHEEPYRLATLGVVISEGAPKREEAHG